MCFIKLLPSVSELSERRLNCVKLARKRGKTCLSHYPRVLRVMILMNVLVVPVGDFYFSDKLRTIFAYIFGYLSGLFTFAETLRHICHPACVGLRAAAFIFFALMKYGILYGFQL